MTRLSLRDLLDRSAAILLTTLLLLALWAGTALPRTAAQEISPTMEQGSLRLWPEYDDPGLLVIFTGSFTETTSFPRQVAFPIAEGARNIQATYRDTSGNLLVREYSIADGKLTYELPLPAFHYEYYVDRPPSGDQREIIFNFDPGYTTKSLEISVQQPARATDFSVTPAAQTSYRDADGLTHHVINLTDIQPGKPTAIIVRYTKNDSELSKPQITVTGSEANAAATAAATSTDRSALPYILIGLGGVTLVGALAYFFLIQRRPKSAAGMSAGSTGKSRPAAASKTVPPAEARRGLRPTVSTKASTPGRPGVVFCTQCGHALQPPDHYCSQCGTQRR